jgi:hypothetical protein
MDPIYFSNAKKIDFYFRRVAELLLVAVLVQQNQAQRLMNLCKTDDVLSFFFIIYICVRVCVD